jgi:hypothetical protein
VNLFTPVTRILVKILPGRVDLSVGLHFVAEIESEATCSCHGEPRSILPPTLLNNKTPLK